MKAFACLLAVGVIAQAAWARPVLPEPPLGTGAASFSGGGTAHMAGPNALFVNPAALSIPDGFQAEAGMMGFSSGFSPYFLYGSNAGKHNAYALGYFYDARVDPQTGGPAQQGMIAGGSWDVDSKASLGMAAHSRGTGSGVGLDGFGVDLDGGVLYRPVRTLWAGLAVHNLLESGLGQEPKGYMTRRSYLGALGLRTPVYDVLGIRLYDPDTFYELRSSGFPPKTFVHAFSMASGFLPDGKLSLRGTFQIPHGGTPGFALGAFISFPAGRAGFIGGYTFDSGAGGDAMAESSPSHSISMNFHLGVDRDMFPPVVSVRADRLAPAQDSAGNVQVHFRLSASDKTLVVSRPEGDSRAIKGRSLDQFEDGMRGYGQKFEEGRIRDWKLVVHRVEPGGRTGPLVRGFEGKELPPRIIRWDGRNDAGEALPPGMYAFRFSARDLSSNESVTAWQLLDLTPAGISSTPAGSETDSTDYGDFN